ncbi:MAG: DNA translocase FtsK [Verrucomicrobiota bacterium]|nr:DNA translocase FtsK [Verrucomicrobiota bacterium]
MANKSDVKVDTLWLDVGGLALLGLSLLLFFSLFSYSPGDYFYVSSTEQKEIGNAGGNIGMWMSFFLFFTIGLASYLLPILVLLSAWTLGIKKEVVRLPQLVWAVVMLLSVACFVQLVVPTLGIKRFSYVGSGGFIGKLLTEKVFIKSFGSSTSGIIFITTYLASLIFLVGIRPMEMAHEGFLWVVQWWKTREDEQINNATDPMKKAELMRKRAVKLGKEADKLLKSDDDLVLNPPSATAPADQTPARPRKIIDTTLPVTPSNSKEKDKDSADSHGVSSENEPANAKVEKGKSPARSSGPQPREKVNPGLTHLTLSHYELPETELLQKQDPKLNVVTSSEFLAEQSEQLVRTLKQFGVEVTAGDITKGPTITRFELYPAIGVKVEKIVALEKNIAMALKAERINILAPIPGKDTVGVEVANVHKVKVLMREMLDSEEWKNTTAKIPITIGKDVYGKSIIGDLAIMPHLLIGGTTGSGKSVFVNSLITSILYRFSPEDLRFIMIDPKVVELQIYNKLPHLVVPVINDPKKVLLALRWVISEMEKRYQIFAKVGVRNIATFNNRPKVEKLPKVEDLDLEKKFDKLNTEDDSSEEFIDEPIPIAVPRDFDLVIPDKMPYIVVLIDELADLMQTAPADVESAIARITQMARAAGIHMVVATQTPRADVVTGVIKANIPTRISFQVASKLDSRVILDQNGAEKLLGQGDMSYLPPGSSKAVRCQGVYLTDEEVAAVVDRCAAQAPVVFEKEIESKLTKGNNDDDEVSEEDKELCRKCLEVIRQERRASTSLLQRRLSLGYTRAARIVDIFEKYGILGPENGAKPRDIEVDLSNPNDFERILRYFD